MIRLYDLRMRLVGETSRVFRPFQNLSGDIRSVRVVAHMRRNVMCKTLI